MQALAGYPHGPHLPQNHGQGIAASSSQGTAVSTSLGTIPRKSRRSPSDPGDVSGPSANATGGGNAPRLMIPSSARLAKPAVLKNPTADGARTPTAAGAASGHAPNTGDEHDHMDAS